MHLICLGWPQFMSVVQLLSLTEPLFVPKSPSFGMISYVITVLREKGSHTFLASVFGRKELGHALPLASHSRLTMLRRLCPPQSADGKLEAWKLTYLTIHIVTGKSCS